MLIEFRDKNDAFDNISNSINSKKRFIIFIFKSYYLSAIQMNKSFIVCLLIIAIHANLLNHLQTSYQTCCPETYVL